MATKNLVQIIRDNPGSVAVIDNDYWSLLRQPSDQNPHWDNDDDDDEAAEKWDEENILAQAGDDFVPRLGDGGYGSGHFYGGDILQALAIIVGIKVESV